MYRIPQGCRQAAPNVHQPKKGRVSCAESGTLTESRVWFHFSHIKEEVSI